MCTDRWWADGHTETVETVSVNVIGKRININRLNSVMETSTPVYPVLRNHKSLIITKCLVSIKY